ncbi:MAG: M14 family metallopeptidase [Acidobacteriota bacterium]
MPALLLALMLGWGLAAAPAMALPAMEQPVAESSEPGTPGGTSGIDERFWLPQDLLPPELPWDGRSQRWKVGSEDPWVTPAERDQLLVTPDYDDSVAYLERLAAASPQIQLLPIGKTPQGRTLWLAVVSAEGLSSPGELAASGKPILLAHGGIHSGEVDGKDAGLMLLRDLTVAAERSGAGALLERAHLLFIPVLNPDGHERSGPYHRVNQRGPEEMGWRTNALNLNLNRDFAKLDTAEVRALVEVVNEWKPDLYLDLHVTDGADYQYDITYGANGPHGWSPGGATWIQQVLEPALAEDLESEGHIPGRLVFLVDKADPSRGNFGWTAGPRFSNGYGDARHLPTVLVENHSLKPYPQRVLGTYVLLRTSLRVLGEEGLALRQATAEDRRELRDPLPLGFQQASDWAPVAEDFLGVESRVELSPITGRPEVRYTGRPVTLSVPLLDTTEPSLSVARPAAYWIPPQWGEVAERLRAHGVELERVAEDRWVTGTRYRLLDPQLDSDVFEGRMRVSASVEGEAARALLPAGSWRVATDQPLGTLAMLLLEPQAADSFFQWGFFHSVLQRTEYIESYVVEPLARRMLEADEALAEEFQQRLRSDAEFAADPRARLDFFYRRTPYYDAQFQVYPILREEPEGSRSEESASGSSSPAS